MIGYYRRHKNLCSSNFSIGNNPKACASIFVLESKRKDGRVHPKCTTIIPIFVPEKFRKIEDPGSATSSAGSTVPSNLPLTPPSITTTTVAISTSSTTTCLSNGSSRRARVSFVTESVTTFEQTNDLIIADLCTKIATCSPDLPKYGCLKNDTRQYIVQPLCKASTQPQEYVSLSELLNRTTKPTRRQRFQVGLILASSFVQPHPTPCLHSTWSKKNILFLCDADDKNKISTDQAYISRPLTKSIQSSLSNASLTPTDRTLQESIHNLGIMFIELCFSKAIEDHELCASINAKDNRIMQALLYGIASDLAQHVVEETGPDYSDAVEWCLHHRLENTAGDENDEKWREDMMMRVVEPLKNCHDLLMAV
ncbi:uncharacterized protein PAC_11895 [Phialocephala subalpina]|uniref:DUF7580 domain-containing protein n=1 Tax=Phialocephala subalpina TaxID=576137 RepID=A0A1L7XAC7_9HELO|nr:uncharacterized protein PAC_11895 [Phialocephala subalpina]